MSNQLLSRSCYLLGMFFGLVWGFADSLHTLRHPEGRSIFALAQSVLFLICCGVAMLVMIVLACFGRISLPLLQ
jgi:hypothetical protein